MAAVEALIKTYEEQVLASGKTPQLEKELERLYAQRQTSAVCAAKTAEVARLPRCMAACCGFRTLDLDEDGLCAVCACESGVQMITHAEMTREELRGELYRRRGCWCPGEYDSVMAELAKKQ